MVGVTSIRDFFKKFKAEQKQPENSGSSDQRSIFSSNLSENLQLLHASFDLCSDIVFREFKICEKSNAAIVFSQVLVNIELVDLNILKPLFHADIDLSLKNLAQTFLSSSINIGRNHQLATQTPLRLPLQLQQDTVLDHPSKHRVTSNLINIVFLIDTFF